MPLFQNEMQKAFGKTKINSQVFHRSSDSFQPPYSSCLQNSQTYIGRMSTEEKCVFTQYKKY